VKVIDDHTLIVPDWAGNNRLDTFTNVLVNGRIGAIFLIPGVDEACRINGAVALRNDEALTSLCEVKGRYPKIVLHVTVEQAYLHCAKAIMRAQLWATASRVDRSVLPTMNEMLREQIDQTEPAEAEAVTLARMRAELYSTR
jgi:PPOX class probable FMN-dependent enzyme